MAGVLAFEDFEIDGTRSELRRGGRALKVDALVIELLAYLASRRGELIAHEELIRDVWGGRAVSDNVVSVCVAKLRKVLGHKRGEREIVVNVYGRGYRFVPAVRALPRSEERLEAARAETPRAAPFFGRDAIMTRLTGALAGARQYRGGVCALIGEPGIGKTRIAEALEQHATPIGVRVVWGRAHELEGAPPFWPWAQVLRGLIAALPIERVTATLGPSFAELARVVPELAGLPHAEAPVARDDSARYRTFDAIARLLACAGEHGPWLLVLDDMHRADAASLELLCYLVDEIGRLPVVLLVTLRSTEPTRCPEERRHLEYALGHRNCERIEVAPLCQRDVDACTEAVLGHPDEALARAVFQKSEGNAFFMTELLREAGELHGTKGSERPSFPPAALDLMRQRVRRAGDEALGYLRMAAVLGRSFELGLLSRVAEVPAPVLLESLDHALATELIVAAPEGLAQFAFGHELIRTVLYEALPKLEAAALHLRVARVLSTLQIEGRTVAAEELAHHYLRALPYGDPEHAAERAEHAADAAMSVSAYSDAVGFLLRAQAALDLAIAPAPQLRCRLHFKISVCLRVSDARESTAALRKAVTLARRTGQYDLLAMAGQAMVRAPGVVMLEEGRAVLEDALAGLGEHEHALRSTVLSHLAWCAPNCFDRDLARSLAARALEHAEKAKSPPALITALRTRLYLDAGPLRPASETERLLEQADRVAAQGGRATRVTWAHQASAIRAALALRHGDRAGVERALETMSASARELTHAELMWHSDRVRVIDAMNRGELREARAKLRELRTRGKSLQLFVHEQVCSHDFLVWQRQTIDLRGSDAAHSYALCAAPQDSPSVLALKLRAAVDLHRADLARELFEEFVQRGFERLPYDRDYLGVLVHLARGALLLCDAPRAEALLALLAPHAQLCSSDISFHSDGAVAHSAGLLARYLGKRDEAVGYFHVAVAVNEHALMRARSLESRCELAATLLQGGRQETVLTRELLEAVVEGARTLGMEPLLERAIMLLATCLRRPRERAQAVR
jgi:DNA-binding winged helix-turn-helix (wHTH) protein